MGGWRKRAERVEKLSLHSLRALSKSLVQRVLVDVVDGGPRRVVEVRRGRIWGHLRASPHTVSRLASGGYDAVGRVGFLVEG
jgi:hypothetical protein